MEKLIQRPVEVERVVERVVEVPVERVVEVEKVVGMREEEVEALRSNIRSRAEAEREELIRQGLIERENVDRRAKQLKEQQERAEAEVCTSSQTGAPNSPKWPTIGTKVSWIFGRFFPCCRTACRYLSDERCIHSSSLNLHQRRR